MEHIPTMTTARAAATKPKTTTAKPAAATSGSCENYTVQAKCTKNSSTSQTCRTGKKEGCEWVKNKCQLHCVTVSKMTQK